MIFSFKPSATSPGSERHKFFKFGCVELYFLLGGKTGILITHLAGFAIKETIPTAVNLTRNMRGYYVLLLSISAT
jgi:hypothetical protein